MRRCVCILACVLLIGGILLSLSFDDAHNTTVIQPPVLIFLLDDSYSMTASCGSSSRLAVAQDLITRIADACGDADVALVTFSGDAMLDVPPTCDRNAFLTALAEVEPSLAASPGSHPAAGLALAEATAHGRPAIAVMITDGEEQQAATAYYSTVAAERTLPLAWCIVGEGPAVPMPLGTSWLRDPDTHEVALTRASPEAIAALADASPAPQLRIPLDDDAQRIAQFLQQHLDKPQDTHGARETGRRLAVCTASLGAAAMMLLWLGLGRMLMLSALVMLTTASFAAETPCDLTNAAVELLQQAQSATEPTTALDHLRRARQLTVEALRQQPDLAAAQHNLRVIVQLEQRWQKPEASAEPIASQQDAKTDEALQLAGEPGPAPLKDMPETSRSAGANGTSTTTGSEGKISSAQPAAGSPGTAAAGSWRHILKREQSLKKRPTGVKPW